MADVLRNKSNTYFQKRNHIRLKKSEVTKKFILDAAVQRADALGKTIASGDDAPSGPSGGSALILQMQTTTASESITLPMTGNVSVDIDWDDGTTETVTTDSPSHTYATAGTYDIKTTGSCDLFSFDGGGDDDKLLAVLNGENAGGAFVVDSFANGFSGCSNLASADFTGLDTSNVTNMSSMFNQCGSLSSLDISSFDTSNVTSTRLMFSNCTSLTALDVSGFNTSSVTNMGFMFNNCSGISVLDVSGFDTSNVNDMLLMFSTCSSLSTVDVTGFNTSLVTSMSSMFRNCSGLTSLDVSGFDTSNVTTMRNMLRGCSNLTSDPGLASFNVTSLDTGDDLCNGANAMLSESEYNTILVNWEAQAVLNNVEVHFGDAVYSGAGATARSALIADHTWTIIDGGAA